MSQGWIGFDLDGTLAEYHGWRKDGGIGRPVPMMVDLVSELLSKGKDVRIFTARVSGKDKVRQGELIRMWCIKHLGRPLSVTCKKDMAMIMLYDDRCKQVVKNKGIIVGG